MSKPDSSQKWLEAGYELFALEGPEGIQVEKLARVLNLNKSGFYHHFGDREIFISELLDYHDRVNKKFCDELLPAKHFDPDFLILLIRYKTTLYVQAQLRRNLRVPLFNEEFIRIINRNDKVIIPLWADYLNIADNHDLAKELWGILRDVVFMRMTNDKFNLEFIRSQIFEFAEIVKVIRNSSLNSI